MTTPANISRRDYFAATAMSEFINGNNMMSLTGTLREIQEAQRMLRGQVAEQSTLLADAMLAHLDAQPEAPKAQGEAVVYPVIVGKPEDVNGWVYRSKNDGDYWINGKYAAKAGVPSDEYPSPRRTPAEAGAWFTENYFPKGVRKVWPVVMRGMATTLVYRSETDGDQVHHDGGRVVLCRAPATMNAGAFAILPPAESAAFLASHGYNPDGTRKASPPAPDTMCECGDTYADHFPNKPGKPCAKYGCGCKAFKASPPAPVKGEEKCVHCGKVKIDHIGGTYCNDKTGDFQEFTPAPHPTEQKAETPAPDAELAAAKEAVVEAAKKIHASFKVKGEYSGEDFYALMGLVSQLIALESRKAVKAEGEWPKVFIGKDGADVRVMRNRKDGDLFVKGKAEGKTCCSVDEIRASKDQRELPRNEVPAFLKSINYNADGTKAVKPASTHRYRLLEDGMMIFGDGPLEALQAWVNKIAAEDKAVQPC